MQDSFLKVAAPQRPRIALTAPSIAPFSAMPRRRAKPRHILIDAAACFIATALGSLSPQALNLLDFAPGAQIFANVDHQSGKFTDRVLIGGLQPIAWDSADVAPVPVFTAMPMLAFEDGPARETVQRAAAAPVAKPIRLAKEAGARRPERTEEPSPATAIPTPPARDSGEPAHAEAKPESAEPGMFSALTASALSSKLTPVGQRVWSGAKSVGGVVSGGLSWIGY